MGSLGVERVSRDGHPYKIGQKSAKIVPFPFIVDMNFKEWDICSGNSFTIVASSMFRNFILCCERIERNEVCMVWQPHTLSDK